MSEKEKTEKLLTMDEVREVLEKLKDQPLEIYSGPEKDTIEEAISEAIEGEMTEDRAKELSFEKRASLDHVAAFSKIEKEKAHEMVSKLMELERVNDAHAFKISELMPRDETELRAVFAKDRFTLEPEELKKILDIIDSYRV